MLWLVIFIYCLLIICVLIVEAKVKRKFNIPKKFKHTRSYNKNRTFVEIVIIIVFMIGIVMANISRYENGEYHPLNPVPLYLWFALFTFFLFGFRRYMLKKSSTDSKEYVIYFMYALVTPFIIIVGHYAAKILLVYI